tara:strand:- start:3574 stop:4011 length:438 start_codon:yes stop_codon:yes gene_type:complete
MKKRFDKALYDKYDKAARQRTQLHLERKGYKVREHPDRYAQDLIATKGGKDLLVECEVKVVWDTDKFPYDTVQLPERKKKFFVEPTLFYIWNNKLNKAITFFSEDVKHLTPVEVPNKYVYKGEYFFQIPMDLTKTIKVKINEANT